MLIIGLGYKKGRGKDMLARLWMEQHPEVKRFAFADELKREVTREIERRHKRDFGDQLFGFEKAIREMCAEAKVPWEANPDMTDPLCPYGKQRRLLQWWGTEFRRVQFGEHYWVERLGENIAVSKPTVAVITDMRFLNEMRFVKQFGGYTVKVERPNLPDEDDHPSERMLDGCSFDFTIMALTLDEAKVKSMVLWNQIQKRFKDEWRPKSAHP